MVTIVARRQPAGRVGPLVGVVGGVARSNTPLLGPQAGRVALCARAHGFAYSIHLSEFYRHDHGINDSR